MDTKLGKEIASFAKEAKRLRKILNDTKKCFADINVTAEIISADLSPEEEFEIASLTKKPPCFLIYGTNNACKACVANSILGSPIFPVFWDNRNDSCWRTVRLKHGVKRSTSLNLPGSYELVDIDNLISQNKSWETLPLADLQKGSRNHDGSPDKAKEAAVLDVSVRSPVLDEGAIVTLLETPIAPVSLKQEYMKYSSDMLPIMIYAIHNDTLGQENLEELLELKESQLDVTIFFVKVTEEQFKNNQLSPGKRKHGRVSNKQRGVQKLANPLEGIRETLEKNHITADYVQRRVGVVDNRNFKNTPQNSGSELQSSIRDLLPCRNHNKANCPICTLDTNDLTEDGLPCKVFISDHPRGSDSDLDLDEEEEATETDVQFQLDCTASDINMEGDSGKFSSDNNTSPKNDLTDSSVSIEPTTNAISLRKQSSQRLCAFNLFQQLLNMGFLNVLPPSNRYSCSDFEAFVISSTDSELVENFDQVDKLIGFTHQILKRRLVHAASMLHITHQRCLQMFITTAFDMARDMQVTPKKLEFARKKETDLFSGLLEIALKKQDEIKKMIAETIEDMREELLTRAEEYDFIGVEIPENGQIKSSKDLKICIGQIQALVLEHLNSTIANKLLSSISIFKDSYTGVLKRCLESLEKSDTHNADSVRTSLALGEILNAAYQVEITVRAGASVVRILLEKMKQLMHSMTWSNSTKIDSVWKRKVATDMLDSLSEYRLAKSICSQIKERLKQSHETFSSALKQLENRHSGRLERTEEQRLKVRKVHAPRVARMALESISMKDYILYGMPEYGREVGRGQYGVVYSCDSWGGFGPCAIKSVVPPDDKHWNDLALEFHYTKDVPEHERLVSLRGSVIDYSYGGGCSPAVLLVMDRYQRDLYTGIKAGLDWHLRLQVSIDVVEGIRFLHSQGLVHRDIKLKNVLLDKQNRGRLTDLGFCKPEAMMSGSIVGTPIHMAPELFSGKYDGSVDVYAFGVLFWYVCAGHVKLPYAFEQCTNKEMLWTSVKRGVRPERLPRFTDDCWSLMTSCWHGDPDRRPHLGVVQPQIQSILDDVKTKLKSRTSADRHGGGSAKLRFAEEEDDRRL